MANKTHGLVVNTYVTLNDQKATGNVSLVQISTRDYVGSPLVFFEAEQTFTKNKDVFGRGRFKCENFIREKDRRLKVLPVDETIADLAQVVNQVDHSLSMSYLPVPRDWQINKKQTGPVGKIQKVPRAARKEKQTE